MKFKKQLLRFVIPVLIVLLSPLMAFPGILLGVFWLAAFPPTQIQQIDLVGYPLIFGYIFVLITFIAGLIWFVVELVRLRMKLDPLIQLKRRLRL